MVVTSHCYRQRHLRSEMPDLPKGRWPSRPGTWRKEVPEGGLNPHELEELTWLRILAQGGTVHDLARQVGYSERALYRLLHALYGRMGVSSRTEAIL